MRDIIEATLCKDHFLKCSTYSIARNGEGLTPCLSISIPERLSKYWAYIDFKKANGETFKTPRIDVVENKISYEIDGSVLDTEGKLEVQIIFQNEDNKIWKSYVKEFAVRYSINATDDIPDKQDFIAEAQKTLDEANATLEEIKETGGSGGTTDYVQLDNKPRINGVELVGDKKPVDIGCVPIAEGHGNVDQVYVVDAGGNQTTVTLEDFNFFENGIDDFAYGIPKRNEQGNLFTNTPTKELECANKGYVDSLVGDIETLLGGI